MDLEKQNKEYLGEKSEKEKNFDKINEKVASLGKEVKKYTRFKQDAQIGFVRAKEDGDGEAAKQYQEEVNRHQKTLDALTKDLEKAREELLSYQTKIDSRLAELEKQPGFKEHINEVMIKKFSRKLNKLEQERESILVIEDLLEDHPTFENNFVGMKNGKEQIEKLQAEKEEIEGLLAEKESLEKGRMTQAKEDRIKEIDKQLSDKGGESKLADIESSIAEANNKVSRNKYTVLTYCRNNQLDINEEDIDVFLSKNFAKTKDGKYNFNKTFNNVIKGYDKQIGNYDIALYKLDPSRLQRGDDSAKQVNGNNNNRTNEDESDNPPKWYNFATRFKNWRETGKEGANLEDPENENSANTALANPPKWYNFATRFKIWSERRKQGKEELDPDEIEEIKKVEQGKREFKDSLKYDLVQDYSERYAEELLKESKKVRKVVDKNLNGKDDDDDLAR